MSKTGGPASETFRRIGLVAKKKEHDIGDELDRLADWLQERDLETSCDAAAAELMVEPPQACARAELPGRVDLLVVLGGDGTLLSVARPAAAADVPVLGVNYGSLGFLTATTREEMYEALEAVLAGDYVASSRMMLRAHVETDGKTSARDVLNDAVVNKTSLARIIELEVSVDGEFVSRYRADGLIISTPTGSTAYSLASGGPIVVPSVEAIVLCPISPHMLTNRPLVLPGTARIEVTPVSSDQNIVLTLDGQEGLPIDAGRTVRIQRSPHRFTLLQTGQRSHFEVLRTKLKWGDR